MDSDSDDSSDSMPAGGPNRLSLPVGMLKPTDIFPFSCPGDDVTFKGTKTLRAGALQSNGEGGSPLTLLEQWAAAASDLRLDVFGVGETRLKPVWEHLLIVSIFRRLGSPSSPTTGWDPFPTIPVPPPPELHWASLPPPPGGSPKFVKTVTVEPSLPISPSTHRPLCAPSALTALRPP